MFAPSVRSKAAFAIAGIVISGCATQSTGPYSTTEVSSTDAIVLIGVDSQIALTHVTVPCSLVLFCQYSLGVRRDVMAFPVPIGTKFSVGQVHTMDQRVARIKSEPLMVEKRGIYYYGTLSATTQRAGIRHDVDRRMLIGAKRKFGTRYDEYAAINFSWPDPSEDSKLGFGYQSSPKVQEALRSAPGRRVRLASVAPPKGFDPTCRGGSAISLPDFFPYEEYVRRAFNQELQAAGLLDEGAGSTELNGAVTELAFSTVTGDSYWKIGFRVATTDGRSAAANVTVPFGSTFAAARACPNAEDSFPGGVRRLLEALTESAAFRALLSADGGK